MQAVIISVRKDGIFYARKISEGYYTPKPQRVDGRRVNTEYSSAFTFYTDYEDYNLCREHSRIYAILYTAMTSYREKNYFLNADIPTLKKVAELLNIKIDEAKNENSL